MHFNKFQHQFTGFLMLFDHKNAFLLLAFTAFNRCDSQMILFIQQQARADHVCTSRKPVNPFFNLRVNPVTDNYCKYQCVLSLKLHFKRLLSLLLLLSYCIKKMLFLFCIVWFCFLYVRYIKHFYVLKRSKKLSLGQLFTF